MIDIEKTLESLEQDYGALLIRKPTADAATGDYDIVVDPNDHLSYCTALLNTLAHDGGYVIQSKSNSYMVSFTVAFCPNGTDVVATQAVKIDVFVGLAWNGLGSRNANASFFAELRAGQVDRQLLSDVATVVQKVTYAGHLDKKTKARLTYTLDQIEPCLMKVMPQIKPGQMYQKWPLRWRTADQSIGMIFAWTLRVLISAIWRKLVNRDGAHGLAFQISGMDGSGKSTQVDALNALWTQIPDLRQKHVHLLPNGYPLPHKILLRKTTQSLYTKPYSEAASKRPLVAWAKLGWYLGLFGVSAVHERLLILSGHTVVFDRWFYDFVTDPQRAKISVAFRAGWIWPLKRNRVIRIFLNVPPQVAVDRKGELTLEQAEYLSQRYLTFADKFDCAVIDGGQSIAQVHQAILTRLDRFHRNALGCAS